MNTNNKFSTIYETSTIKFLKAFYTKNEKKLDFAFYFLLSVQFLSDFADTTTLPPIYVWGGSFYELFFAVVTFLFSLSCFSSILFTFLFNDNVNKTDKYCSIILLIISGLYFLTNADPNSTEISDFLFTIAVCIGKSSNKVVKSLLFPGFSLLLITILLSQYGIISDYIYTPMRHSLGFIYCTDFGAHLLFLVIAFIIYKQYKVSHQSVTVILLCFAICQYIANAKTSSFCMLLLLAGISIEYLCIKKLKKSFFQIFKNIMLIIFPLAYTLFCICTTIYTLKPSLFPENTLTTRFSITSDAFGLYNISFFSQYITQSGNGGSSGANADASGNSHNLFSNELSGPSHLIYALVILLLAFISLFLFSRKIYLYGSALSIISFMLIAAPGIVAKYSERIVIGGDGVSNYFWLDCSYIRVLLCNGILVFLTIMILTVYVQYKAYKSNNYLFMFIMCVIALDCTIEHHLTDISYNFIFMLALTDYFDTNKHKKHA